MTRFDLAIHEDRLDEFEQWFATHMPAPAKAYVASFSHLPGGDAVTYRVQVSVPGEKAAAVIKQTWAAQP